MECMLAQAGQPFTDPAWAFEVKWDGVRALAYGEPGHLRLVSRKGLSLLRQFPELADLSSQVLAERFVLDGELVAFDEHERPRFELLLPRIQSDRARVGLAPIAYYVFDVLELEGEDLRQLRWEERRARLEAVLRPGPHVRLSEAIMGEGEAFYEVVRAQGLEGVVAKRRDSPYTPGRSADWQKIKVFQTQECLIVGFTQPSGGRRHFGALVLACEEGGVLVHVGNVGSGFTEAALDDLAARLRPLATCPLATPVEGPITWVHPEFTCQVRYTEKTRQGLLRAPVYQGLVEVVPSRQRQTNRDKLWFPEDGVTKGEVLDYYERVAPLILPQLAERPLSLRRYPDGVGKAHFFQRRSGVDFPAWMPSVSVESDGEWRDNPVCENLAGLLYLVNLGCIDHNPWLSRLRNLDEPDLLLLDLDPVDCGWDRVLLAGRLLGRLLAELGLASFPKTSGSRGLHVLVPVTSGYTFEQTRMLAQLIGTVLVGRHPDLFSVSRARRDGRVYLDAPQNRRGATTACAYSVRAVPGACVSTPLRWEELEEALDFRDFTVRTALARFEKEGDLLGDLFAAPQPLEDAVARLEPLLK